MKNIIKTITSFLLSDAAYLIMQVLIGMWAIERQKYVLAYGIAMLTIIIALKRYKNDTTSN